MRAPLTSRGSLSGRNVVLVHNKISSPASPAALETVACDQLAHKLVDVALGSQTVPAKLVYRAVDDALRDAEGNEESFEAAVIPLAQIIRTARAPHTKNREGPRGLSSPPNTIEIFFISANLHNVTGEVCLDVTSAKSDSL